MKTYANVMIKDESLILSQVSKYWINYPVDKWIFYDDNSKDDTIKTIEEFFGDKATIISGKSKVFNESHNRSSMLELSRNEGADFVLSIDADELLSTSMIEYWSDILEQNLQFDIQYFWFNVVGSINKIRHDPMYVNNYRTFLLPLKHTGSFDLSQYKYHTPRTPKVFLNKVTCSQVGILHLQALNKRYYALKQLWYKHYEYVVWNHPVKYINSRYDPVVNNLDFCEVDTPREICHGIDIDPLIYDEIERIKGYQKYIKENYVKDLVTFGEEYL